MTVAPDAAVVLVALAIPFAGAIALPVAVRLLSERAGYVGATIALASFGLLASQHGREGVVEVAWIPSLDVALTLYVDAWALLFALLASGIGVLVFAYSATYMPGEPSLARYYAALSAFMGSILGVALTADLVALFLFWELTSVCSFVLIGYYADDGGSRYAARMAMLVTVGGGLFLLAGFVLLRVAAAGAIGGGAGDLVVMIENAEAMEAALRERGWFVPVLGLVAVAAGAKSAQVPLHFWLPNAMAAPTPVSAFLHSATMVKVGVYFLGRVRPLLSSPEWTALFATLGLVTMTVTAIMAVASVDVKELLAYSTASHLGLMVAGFGFASYYGAAAGTFHMLNHAAFKAALFLVAGIVAHEAGTRRLSELSGLGRALPVTAVITGIAALGMAGVPPFNGFYSKELLFEAAYQAAHVAGGLWWLLPGLAVVGSVFTFIYSIRFLSMFVGDRPDAIGAVHRAPLGLVVPPGVLALVAGVLGVAPGLGVDAIVGDAMVATGGDPAEVHVGLPTAATPPVLMTAVALGVGAAAYPFYGRLHRGIRRGVAATPPARANWWYDVAIGGLDRVGNAAVPRIQTGLIRTYATWALGATCALALGGYLAASAELPPLELLTAPAPVLVVALVAVIAAVATVRTEAHVVGVLLLSLLGLMLAIAFILASAPDLALTQLVVETLTLLIFLLVIEELPEYYGQFDRFRMARDAILSLGVGATVFVTVLLTAGRTESALARFFTEQAVPGGGGTNVVNVVLVDFRGFDTLGESVVIVIAAIAVLTLILMRDRGESP